MAAFQWKPAITRNVKKPSCFIPAVKHPLQRQGVIELRVDEPAAVSKPITEEKGVRDVPTFFDPLGVAAGQEQATTASDALSNGVESDSFMDAAAGDLQLDGAINPIGLPSWDKSRYEILEKFTTAEKLLIVSDFLHCDEGGKGDENPTEKLRHKMEQLDAFDDRAIKRMASVSQEEYTRKIRELRQKLMTAWESDQRVQSIRIAIQAAKLLSDTQPIRFYPSKFVLITDILDTFGNLVYARLFTKASSDNSAVLITNEQGGSLTAPISESAKETCRNWFFKISSIRELLPRFYMEAAILRSLTFLDTDGHRAALSRLAVMIRGVGDPLVATYARCYLARVGLMLCPKYKQPLTQCLQDSLLTQNQLTLPSYLKDAQNTRILIDSYRPALDWLMHCLAQDSGEKLLTSLMATYAELIRPNQDKWHCMQAELFLTSILGNFHAKLVAPFAENVMGLVEELTAEESQSNILRKLGNCLVAFEPDCDKEQLVQRSWSVILCFKTSSAYINAAETWFHFAACHFDPDQLDVLLGNIVWRMSIDLAYEDHFTELQVILSVLLDRVRPFGLIFGLSNFPSFVDILMKDKSGSVSARRILEGFVAHQAGYSSDVILANTLMNLGRTIHDSLNELSLDDTKQATGKLLCKFMRKFSFNDDFEQQLSFYMEGRGNFQNLDRVLSFLVRAVNALAVKASRKGARTKQTRKQAGFLRACVAYNYITIPSITDVFLRLPLYLESAQVALLNNCLPQADALVADCIRILPLLPARSKVPNYASKIMSNDRQVAEYISELLSFLLVVPDNPEKGMLYFAKGLLEAVKRYPWSAESDLMCDVYLKILVYCSLAAQPTLPYRIPGVDSNDKLYGSRGDYLAELTTLASTSLNTYLDHMQGLADKGSPERLGMLALNLLHTITLYANVADEPLQNLAVKLWKLVQKNSSSALELRFKLFKEDLAKKEAMVGKEGEKFASFKRRLKEA